MKKLKNAMVRLWKDESAQGATEYILMLVIVVAVALLFKDQIMTIIEGKLQELQSSIGSVTSDR